MKGFNVSKHVLVPKHKKLADSEKKELLEHFNISEMDLPKISVEDAAITEMKLKPGDVVKVTRQSSTAGESFYYRVVVNG